MFHKFKPMEALPCLRHRVVSLSGDSTTRQIFWSIVGKSTLQDTDENRGKHEDVHLFDEARNTSLHFYWNPFLNRSTFLETQFDEPSLFLFGGGLWQAKYSLHHNLQDVNINEATHLAPIQAPHFEWLSEERRETLLPERIAEINDVMEHLAATKGIPYLTSFVSMTDGVDGAYATDGVHVQRSVADTKADIVLNWLCNHQKMEVEGPFGSTCCRTYPPFEDIKTSFAAAMLFLVGLLCFGGIRDRWRTTCCALMKILLVLAYCFLADRTHIFSKAQKQYHGSDFHVLCGIALIIGLCRLRHITASPANMFGHVNLLLTQEQTNEWKGWMQAIILIYHYTGASRVYWIYVIARLLVASYLFLTGYGNTLSFLVKKDYSISRVTAVLLKLNMLSAALPWVMQTSYMDYYFAPLVSLWFIIVYSTLGAFRKGNDSIWFLVFKILVAAVSVTAFIKTFGILECLFHLLSPLANWSASEFRFRVCLDLYIVFVGMLVAILELRNTGHFALHEATSAPAPSSPAANFLPTLRHKRKILIILCALKIIFYGVLASTRTSREDYNAHLHPYLSFLPILSYIHLRNLPRFRNYYSAPFAALGRISLETFVLQFHIWLAADTKGLLSTGLFGDARQGQIVPLAGWRSGEVLRGRWRDFVLLGIVFLWVSARAAEATGVVVGAVVRVVKRLVALVNT